MELFNWHFTDLKDSDLVCLLQSLIHLGEFVYWMHSMLN